MSLSARHLALLLLVTLIAACSSQPPATRYNSHYGSDSGPSMSFDDMKDSAPDEQRDWSKIPDAVPKWEPRARYGNHSPYTVLGKNYTVMPSSVGYRETGIASWYGKKFSGRATSSQEPYDPYAMTAAHKRLPLPTYVRVTNLENRKQIIVKVNDRGPFHSDRIIDLSFAAAHKLGYANQGTARVLLEAIDTREPGREAPPPSPAVQPVPTANPPLTAGEFYLQVGAFSDLNAAIRLQQRLATLTQVPVGIFSQFENGRGSLHRVRVGPISSEQDAQRIQQLLRNAGIGESLLIRR